MQISERRPECFSLRATSSEFVVCGKERGADYDTSDTFHRSLAEQLVDRAGLQAGHTVLDLATGTGMVALPAAEKVGSGGKVVAVDTSTTMLAEVCRCVKI